jgi:hypothetical protein
VALPSAYLLGIRDKDVIELLRLHGIRIEALEKDTELPVERFEIAELKGSPRLNQGHYLNSVKGKNVTEKRLFPAGTVVVRMNQPLARVAAYLLEPESGEGLLAWNYFDKYLAPQWGMGFNPYPVYKDFSAVNLLTKEIW